MSNVALTIIFFEKAEQTIESIKSFVESGVNIYVLNNGSSVEEAQKVKEFCKLNRNIKYYNSDVNLGVAKGRNFLINKTKEKYVFLMDNDIKVNTKNWLDIFNAFIKTYGKEYNVFVPKLKFVCDSYINEPKLPIYKLIDKKVVFDQDALKGKYTNTFGGGTIVDRSLFEKLGLFDENIFVNGEEQEFAVRALVKGIDIKGIYIDNIELKHEHKSISTLTDLKAVFCSNNTAIGDKSRSYIQNKYSDLTFPLLEVSQRNHSFIKNFGTYLNDCYFKKSFLKILRKELLRQLEINKTNDIYFYGAGEFVNTLLSDLELSSYNVKGIFDNNKGKQGKKINGLSIYHTDEIIELKPDVIIPSVEEMNYFCNIVENLISKKKVNCCRVINLLKHINLNQIYSELINQYKS